MALIVFRTVTIDDRELEVYCHDEGINVHISGCGSLDADLCYEDIDQLIQFLNKNRLDKE